MGTPGQPARAILLRESKLLAQTSVHASDWGALLGICCGLRERGVLLLRLHCILGLLAGQHRTPDGLHCQEVRMQKEVGPFYSHQHPVYERGSEQLLSERDPEDSPKTVNNQ